ncbi:hypothetical protein CD132_08715, partial [Staphylococcus microti]
MKKIILFLCVAISLTLSLIVIDSAKSLSFYSHVEKDSQKINFYFDTVPKKHDKEAWSYFTYLSKKYNVEITKVTYVNDYKILLNTTDNQLKKEADKNKNLNIFDSGLDIKVFSLNKSNLSIEGIYYLKGNEKDVQQVITLINQDVGLTDVMNASFLDVLSLDLFSISLTVFLILLLFAVLLHDLLNQKEQLKILYDLGYRKAQIIKFVIQNLSKYIWVYALATIILTLLVYIIIYKDAYI